MGENAAAPERQGVHGCFPRLEAGLLCVSGLPFCVSSLRFLLVWPDLFGNCISSRSKYASYLALLFYRVHGMIKI
jgi:hypothetical protein